MHHVELIAVFHNLHRRLIVDVLEIHRVRRDDAVVDSAWRKCPREDCHRKSVNNE